MTINKGLFAHIIVTLILIAGYQFVIGTEESDPIIRLLFLVLLLAVNIGMSEYMKLDGIYKQKIKL